MFITRLKLTKERLASLPEKDRRVLLIVGGLSNEINILQKLMMLTRSTEDAVLNIVEAGQVMFLLRLLAGKLHESRLMLNNLVGSDREFKRRHQLDGDGPAGASLKRVYQHFNKWGTLLGDVRDETFHASDKYGLVEKAFAALPYDEPWDFFLSEEVGNSFYFASELVMSRMMIDMTDRGAAAANNKLAEAEALRELHDAAIRGAGLMAEAFMALMISILADFADELERANEEIPDGPKIEEFHLPYFFNMSGIIGRKAQNS